MRDGRTKIGILTYATDGYGIAESIRYAMARHGYVDGDTAEFRVREANRAIALTEKYADELVEWGADVVFSLLTKSNMVLKQKTAQSGTPVVFWASFPTEGGLIEHVDRPGGNMTGFSSHAMSSLAPLRFIKLATPGITKVGHLFNSTYGPAVSALGTARESGALLGLEIVAQEATTIDDVPSAIEALASRGLKAVTIGPHELFMANGRHIGQLCRAHGLAAVSGQEEVLRGGGLAALLPPFDIGWPMMADVAVRILHGEHPGDIPVNTRITGQMIINVGTARTLGLDLPDKLLREASFLIDQ